MRSSSAILKPAYFELRRISLVNWYLFGCLDIDVVGRIALVGHNGSGKSAILDAVQTCLTGNSWRYLRLNASAQSLRRSKRTVRDYCLGTIDDVPGATPDKPYIHRPRAISYVLLGFERTDTQRRVTAGICLQAWADQNDEDTVATFLAEGAILSAHDVCETGVDDDREWTKALPWSTVAAKLHARDDVSLFSVKGSDVFVRELVKRVGPEASHINHEKFLRNLRTSITFKEVTNHTEFIHNYILDNNPVDVAGLRESIETYRALKEKIAVLLERIGRIKGLSKDTLEIRRRWATVARQRLVALYGHHWIEEQARSVAERNVDLFSAELDRITTELAQLEDQKARARATLDDLKALASQSDAARQRREAEAQERLVLERVRHLQRDLAPVAELLRSCRTAAPLIHSFNKGLSNAFDDLPAGTTPEECFAGFVRVTMEPIRQALDRTATAVVHQIVEAQKLVSRSEEEVEALCTNIQRARQGKVDLERGTLRLMALLQSNGIAATPLCERVTRVDPEWRNAAEALLGPDREALLVAPEHVETAIGLYQSAPLRAGRIINTTKTQGTRPALPRSLAIIVETDDPHVRAFLDYRLGAVMMVRTPAELRREENAVTPDLMYTGGRTTHGIDVRGGPKLGYRAEGLIDTLQARLSVAQAGLDAHRERLERLKTVEAAVRRVAERIAETGALDVGSIVESIAAANTEIRNLRSIIEKAGDGDRELQGSIRDADAALQALDARVGERQKNRGGIEEKIASNRNIADERKEASSRYASQIVSHVAASQFHGLTGESIQTLWTPMVNAIALQIQRTPGIRGDPDSVLFQYPIPNYEQASSLVFSAAELLEIVNFLEDRNIVENTRTARNFTRALYGRLGEYVVTYGLETPEFIKDTDREDQDIRVVRDWLATDLRQLARSELKRHEVGAAAAHKAAQEAFVGDFVSRMSNAFVAIQAKFDELNGQLGKWTFHGLKYRFIKRRNPVYASMAALIDAAADPGFNLPLFDRAAMNRDDKIAPALARLEEIAKDPEADMSDLVDPRRFFIFDIGMTDREGNTKTEASKRSETASGGQIQVPFYVAMAAALGSTYFPDKKGIDGGLSLALFDEAFNRMDQDAIRNCINFMRDIGLQVFLAVPDDKRITYTQMVDTVICIARNGDTMAVDVQTVKEHTREQFYEENPRLQGFAEFKGKHAARSDDSVVPEAVE